jgi:phosphomannomutase
MLSSDVLYRQPHISCLLHQVFVGCDLRESSPSLLLCLKAGLAAFNARVIDVGLVTTPQVHTRLCSHRIESGTIKDRYSLY